MLRFQVEDPFSTDRLNVVGDFQPEWDVPSLGKSFTDTFSAAVDEVRSHPQPKPNRKVHAFLGPAGYGKTHLFGRISHVQGERVYFTFIPALSAGEADDAGEQLESTLRWRLVESLLYSDHTFAPFRLQLAKLFAPSFAAYLGQLGAKWRDTAEELLARLKEDPITVLEFFGQVDSLAPYHLLADGVRTRLPHCSGSVIRALVLGASPAADDARWWLRGEADQIPETRLLALNLVDREKKPLGSPPLIDILRTVAEILRLNNTPLVICFDQLEERFKQDKAVFTALTGQLMSWLQTIPNTLIGIGCHPDLWREVGGLGAYKAFFDRVTVHDLPPLSGAEAVELVRRRVKTWADFDPKRQDGWPFDLESIRAYADENGPAPRYFIQGVCARDFADWEARKREGLIRIGGSKPEVSLEELLKQEWAKELEAAKAGKKPADLQDLELWAGVEEALAIAKEGPYPADGPRILEIHKQPVEAVRTDPRPSVRLVLTGGKSVVVTVNKRDGGAAFGTWLTALQRAVSKSVVGAVVVWPRSNLTVGRTTVGYRNYAVAVEAKTLRPFPLDEHEATFHQLECLRRIMGAARTGNLLLGKQTVGADECRRLIVQTGLLANLKLFEFVFQNWPGLEAVAPPAVAPPVAAPPPAPPAPTPAVATPLPVARPVVPPFPVPVTVAAVAAAAAPVAPPVVPPPSVPAAPPAVPEWVEVMLKKAADHLKKKGQHVQPVGAEVGPTFVRLKVELRGDADSIKIRRQAENLKLHLALEHEPLILSQAGYVSIDVQRPDRQTVLLAPLLAAAPPKFAGEPAFPVGVGVAGNAEWLNLSEPEGCHLLVAGTTGSGKSEFLKAVLASLAARLTPEQVKFRLIDPKRVTFNVDPKCPYLGGPVVYDGEEALPVLEACSEEMERRYKLLQARGVDHVRHLVGADAVPRWVVVMDEFADLMTDRNTRKELEPLLKRLGAKARAAGIHLILGTQRPDASVVTPVLRSNLPGRIGLQVATERDSKLFLDEPDAAYLFGKGDLVWKRGGGLVRLQSPFVPKAEFDRLLRVG